MEIKIETNVSYAIVSRIQHPFIGTLICSFLVYNFDEIYKLAISTKENYFRIKLFMQTFQMTPSRHCYSIIVAFFVSIFADSILYNLKRIIEFYISNLTNRYFEMSNTISPENEMNNLESSIGYLFDENNRIRTFINSFTPTLIE